MAISPQAFGKFVLIDKLAMGGMAEVWRAKSFGAEGIGKIVAIKRILPQFSANSEFIDMFKEEAKITVNLNHANIVPIYEFGEEQGTFFLVMDFVDGRNLRQILSRCSKMQKSLTVEQCVHIMAEVAKGLHHAHNCRDKNSDRDLKIIHRDMSPQNIMVSFEGEIKVVDFGIAKAETKIETTRTGTLKGKFGYMSPEQADGLELDARTDIFSLGIVLWELLSGERLFVANNEMNTIRKIRECNIPSLKKINPNIDEELDRITLRALAKDKGLRYQTANELFKDLNRYLYKMSPDFTSQELMSVLKSLFKEEIVNDRILAAEIAKIKPMMSTRDDKTMVVRESTYTTTQTSTSDGIPQNLVDEHLLKKDVDLAVKVDRVELLRKVQSVGLQGGQNHRPSQHSPIRPLGAPPLTSTQSGFTRGQTHTGTIRRAPTTSNHLSTFMIFISVIGLLAGGGYLAIKNGWVSQKILGSATFSSVSKKILGRPEAVEHATTDTQTNPVTPATNESHSVTPAITTNGTTRLNVRSIPSGADIEIDGVKKGETPAEIQIPFQKKISIVLRKRGYLPYSEEYTGTSTSRTEYFNGTLLTTKAAFLNITTVPNDAEIYINGKKVGTRSPINKFQIEANTKVTIRAVNEFAKLSADTVVLVPENKAQNVQLFLKKTK